MREFAPARRQPTGGDLGPGAHNHETACSVVAGRHLAVSRLFGPGRAVARRPVTPSLGMDETMMKNATQVNERGARHGI